MWRLALAVSTWRPFWSPSSHKFPTYFQVHCRGVPKWDIKGFISQNCRALYLKGTGHQVQQVPDQVNNKFIPQDEILGTPLPRWRHIVWLCRRTVVLDGSKLHIGGEVCCLRLLCCSWEILISCCHRPQPQRRAISSIISDVPGVDEISLCGSVALRHRVTRIAP